MRTLSILVGGLECQVQHDDDVHIYIALIFWVLELGEWVWFIQKKRSKIDPKGKPQS
jgi:hypothetical protein